MRGYQEERLVSSTTSTDKTANTLDVRNRYRRFFTINRGSFEDIDFISEHYHVSQTVCGLVSRAKHHRPILENTRRESRAL